MLPLKRSNINLLICLDMLLTERSVTRAAERLEMSQPGMSNALSRLRELIGDPLLVRSGNVYILTERAAAIAHKVRSGIELMDEIFANEGPMDLGQASGTVTLAAAESVALAFVPALIEIMSQAAPNLTLNIRAPDPEHLHEWLREGECDIALGFFPNVHPDLRKTSLFQQPLSCVSAAGENRGELLSKEDYLQRRHVVFGSPFSPRSTLEHLVSSELAAMGVERLRTVRVSSALIIPHIVAASSYIATMPTWLCRYYARILDLTVSPLPFKLSPLETDMVWHERTHRLSVHVWLRNILRTIIPGSAVTGEDIRLYS